MVYDWSREEVEAAVADYFDMLEKELLRIPYNKSEHRRRLQQIIKRSKGSIEYKHQNITAILIDLECAYIPGYKPRFNYQHRLLEVVESRLAETTHLHELAKKWMEKPQEKLPFITDILSVLVPQPVRDKDRPTLRDRRCSASVQSLNRLEVEARNRSLGSAGEEFIIRYEHERLRRAGHQRLADRVEHVARTVGDGLGYDILSFEENGQERFIEVKTTRLGGFTPFYASSNEVKTSELYGEVYQLYRLFQFSEKPRLFILKGSLHDTCSLEASVFKIKPKSTV